MNRDNVRFRVDGEFGVNSFSSFVRGIRKRRVMERRQGAETVSKKELLSISEGCDRKCFITTEDIHVDVSQP
jgi:hypothetical protein